MAKKSDKLVSEIIEDFLNLVSNTKSDYEYTKEIIKQLDIEYDIDIGHAFELNPTKDKGKLATRARINRLDRRYYKDINEEYEPLFKLVTDGRYKQAFDLLTQALGQTRKAESYHKDRSYKPRVTDDNKISKKIIR